MMIHAQRPSNSHCRLLGVACSKLSDKLKKKDLIDDKPAYPFPNLSSSGCVEVQILSNPGVKELQQVLQSFEPSVLYFLGECNEETEEIASPSLPDVDFSAPEALCDLFDHKFPATVYLEIPNGENLAEALHLKGVPHVIYWKSSVSYYLASHFHHALFSVLQSCVTLSYDAFQLAHASYSLCCALGNYFLPSDHHKVGESGPCLLGDPPLNISNLLEANIGDEEHSYEKLSSIKIHDVHINMKFLVCGLPLSADAFILGSLEAGLNALLNVEIRGCKLYNRTSATPPPLQAGSLSRGLVTMRCDILTCSSAHISLLVSGSAETCFNDQILEDHIRNELTESGHVIHVASSEENKVPFCEARKSTSIACGASVFEVSLKVPTWASQVLWQLAPNLSHRSLVMLGIASIQGRPVAAFEEDDAEGFLFFCKNHKGVEPNNHAPNAAAITQLPTWLIPPAPTRKASDSCQKAKLFSSTAPESGDDGVNLKRKLCVASMSPIPRLHRHKMLPFIGFSEAERYDGEQPNPSLPAVPALVVSRKSLSNLYQVPQVISINPLPLKKHGCARSPIQDCSEEEFLKDVMEFLMWRGHARLVPQGGIEEFPDAILNAKRLDLFNLYREVVSRGGFHVGNGINWKGQVFSKMHNHTLTNRMTGVGNTLKRHYETYLLEYELAHDDVDGECCLLCHSSAAGDWVNCGICDEWAHFGCDRRPSLGAFKDYAKTDGLEYVCPHCSASNVRRKSNSAANGY